MAYELERFLKAQEIDYATALAEMQDGEKRSHWIWYIFPQEKGLGRSFNSEFYGLDGESEAREYLEHPILGARLREVCNALLNHKGKNIYEIMGSHIDAIKLRSSMTLFDKVKPNDIFAEVIKTFF